jgi:hypothetical protein
MVGLLLFSAVLLWLFIIVPVSAPQFIGPLGVLFYTAAGWTAFSSCALVYPVHRFRLPSFLIIGICCGIVFALWNENHHIRKVPGSAATGRRKPAVEQLHAWLSARLPGKAEREESIPVFVVAAEGGGIRSAYWTASVLSYLEDSFPGFGSHVFAISGVSGGSLGAAVFTALYADRLDFTEEVADETGTAPRLLPKARTILSHDFLSPPIAAYLFPDLIQNFWPFSDRAPFGGKLALPDRAAYLEKSWEVAWRRGTSNNRFSQDFMRLWKNRQRSLEVPSLFFNGTWVETGRRLAMSNLSIDTVDFVHLDDVAPMIGYPVRLSTAVNMSTRFPYLSPAGTVEADGKKRHVVDGAYFENSGALTAEELIRLVRRVCHETPEFSVFRPVALIITNTPLNPCSKKHRGTKKEHKVPQLLIGSSAPLRAFFNSRLARGYHAERLLQKSAGEANTIRFHLEELEDVSIPLGWILSGKARRLIDGQLEAHPGVDEIRKLMKAGTVRPD